MGNFVRISLILCCVLLSTVAHGAGAGGGELERNHSLEEKHESNGPEGSAGVPMQRISLTGFVAVVAVMGASGALIALGTESSRNETR
jgi:hypothetical protein